MEVDILGMPTKNLPRDVFLYLLAIISLITVAVSFGVIIFQVINIYIPDVVSDQYSRASYFDSMRYSLATIAVVFPVFLWVSWFLKRDIINFPEKRELKIRKWLLYLTLFVASIVIIGDLVTLLSNFLNGELSQRFILKVFAILFIAGSILTHYLSELKEKSQESGWIKIFDWVVISVVVVSIVTGFIIAGSPQSQRLIRLDNQRTSDLQNIQWQIINYWQRKEVLPETLNDLADPISNFMVPKDPEAGAGYEYRVKDHLKFELCATFSTINKEDTTQLLGGKPVAQPIDSRPVYNPVDYNWQHDQGRACFNRTIDPDLYPPLKK